MKASALQALPFTSSSSATTATGRPRVLVADDSRVIRQATRKILGADFDVLLAENGEGAWEQIQQDAEIMALITDIEMPGLDGYELICRIRGTDNARLRDLPVIAITGADDDATRQRALACGATDFIIKPIDATQLLARVQAYVRYDASMRELTQKAAALEEQSVSDPVTGLRSRRYIMERGAQDLAFSIRRERDLTLIRIDIDGFKKIYQTAGDETCDRLLLWLARILLANARTEDAVARTGGAEFAILANFTEIETAAVLCERLRKAILSQPFMDRGEVLPVTLSMGLSSLGQDRLDTIEGLLKLAQQRLCHAQSDGGNRVCSRLEEEGATEEVSVLPVALAPSSEPAKESKPHDAVDELSVAELEELIKSESEPLEPVTLVEVEASALRAPVSPTPVLALIPAPSPVAAANAMLELLSVDRALHLIAQGRGEMLIPHIERLMQQVKPLLELHGRVNDSTDVIG